MKRRRAIGAQAAARSRATEGRNCCSTILEVESLAEHHVEPSAHEPVIAPVLLGDLDGAPYMLILIKPANHELAQVMAHLDAMGRIEPPIQAVELLVDRELCCSRALRLRVREQCCMHVLPPPPRGSHFLPKHFLCSSAAAWCASRKCLTSLVWCLTPVLRVGDDKDRGPIWPNQELEMVSNPNPAQALAKPAATVEHCHTHG